VKETTAMIQSRREDQKARISLAEKPEKRLIETD
jgi:hypothetical protein